MDNILQNTLSGTTTPEMPKAMQAPNLTGNNQTDIASLKGAQKQPSDLLNLQKAMTLASKTAYDERQANEMNITGQQFDPTKVSGGTFAGIISNLEQNRGMDISKVYASTLSTYAQVQNTITERLEFLTQLEEQKKQWEEEMKMRKKEFARLEKEDKKAAKFAKKQFEEDKRRWEINYADSKKVLRQEIDFLNTKAIDTTKSEWNAMNGSTPQAKAPSFTDWLFGK